MRRPPRALVRPTHDAMSCSIRECTAPIQRTTWAAQDTPDTNIREMALQGANVWRVNGYIDDCGKIVAGGDKEVPFAFPALPYSAVLAGSVLNAPVPCSTARYWRVLTHSLAAMRR